MDGDLQAVLERVADCDTGQAGCWRGGRVAEALYAFSAEGALRRLFTDHMSHGPTPNPVDPLSTALG